MVHARRDEHTLHKIVERVIDVLAICPDNIMINHSQDDNDPLLDPRLLPNR